MFSAAPTFWGDEAGAIQAAQAIIAELGTIDTTTTLFDSFTVPFFAAGDQPITPGFDSILGRFDSDFTAAVDVENDTSINDTGNVPEAPFASFQRVVVPVPAAVWLFGSGLMGLVGIARKKKAA
ncbi:MAG: VPLPA-CTERM sorting domain-containing protein [Pseudomonadota bacterium]